MTADRPGLPPDAPPGDSAPMAAADASALGGATAWEGLPDQPATTSTDTPAESMSLADGTITAPPLEPPGVDTRATEAAPSSSDATTSDAAPPAANARTAGRRAAAARGAIRLVQFAFGVALFAVGVWLGTLAFQSTQSDPQTVGAGVVANGTPTPPVVEEFAAALASGGPDAVRSSVSTEVFALLASELSRWNYTSIGKVDVLSTTVDGPRSATGLVLTGTTNTGTTLAINLIVQTDGGRISTLR